jgi:AcrR family transcriptional regulator
MVRSDARENRSRILDAARTAFAETGEVSMNRIAQLAGVGAGTLYRNFPTREALVLAVYEQEVQRIVDDVDPLLARMPPREALRVWTMGLVDAMLQKHGLGDAISAGSLQALNEQTYGPVISAITRLLDAGKADGSIRPDADPDDYLQLTGALWRAEAGAAARADRMLALVLDGLRPR